MNTTPDHPDFTALALGEHILGAPSQVVTEALRTSVAARNEAEQIRLTARKLSMVLKGQPVARLDASRRNAIFNADVTRVHARFAAEEAAAAALALVLLPDPVTVRRRSWWLPAAAAAVIVTGAVAAFTMFPAQRPPSSGAPLAQQPVTPGDKVNIEVGTPAIAAPRRTQPPPLVVKSTAPALPQISPAPLKSAPALPPVAPPAMVHQPDKRPDFKPEATPPPPALREPLPDFATPEKRRQK